MGTKPRGKSSFITEFMVSGERFRSTFDTREEGERWEADVRHAIKTGRPVPGAAKAGRVSGGKITTLGQVAEYALKHNWQDNPSYHLAVERIFNEVLEFFGSKALMADIKRPQINDLIAHLRTTGNGNGTINRKLSGLSSLFKVAQELEVITTRPVWPTRLKETATKLRFVYPHEEKALLDNAAYCEDRDLADMIVFALDTGARFSEIVKARWDWFNPKRTSWIIWMRKANNPFAMPLTKRVQAILEKRKNKPGGPFADESYRSVRTRLGNLCERLELDDVTFHTFRHTTASRLVQRGVDLRRVQVWMGHKTISTTIRYAKLAPNDLEDVVKVLEPENTVKSSQTELA